ncbi:efflux RND transporter periplasmic adaptor subunit [Ramlibacter rhizophilus]|uniref:Efflux RND transporter periplasmic adaptor subunit n=1 Tax=Ramlibacter rhizophilus TaxID=1781167 RepID=A0A4Z0BKA4_9BURK|nr:efflux RND transporter periplasmic adaptor subunit [Ramlibacter rhizophilus]TFY99742.1 efflux RND transporter periplasmic adaptor subunit [Ramlibacter rhizophilus]
MRPSRPVLIVASLLLVLVLLALAFYSGLWQRPRPVPAAQAVAMEQEAPPVPVVLEQVTEATGAEALELLGNAAAARSVVLYPAVSGEVAELRFRPGQRVEAAQVLLRLVDRTQRLALDAAAARREQARRLLARYEATRGTGAVPGSLIDEAESALRLARIEEQQAREAVADRTLRAPFSGVVGLTDVEPGDRVAIDTPITTLDDRSTVLVGFEVPEAHAARLGQGQPLSVEHPAWPGRRFEGRITQIDSRVDERTRNLRLRAAVANPQDLLRPGMSLQVRLALPGQPRPAVPELALQYGREGAHVWTVREGRAEQVPVRSLGREQGRVLVDGPLQPGQPVIVEGVQRLRPGRAVQVVEPESGSRPVTGRAVP